MSLSDDFDMLGAIHQVGKMFAALRDSARTGTQKKLANQKNADGSVGAKHTGDTMWTGGTTAPPEPGNRQIKLANKEKK